MKKKYIIPTQTIVCFHVEHHLMDYTTTGNTSSVSNEEADVDGFVKGNNRGSRGNYNVWEDDWSK